MPSSRTCLGRFSEVLEGSSFTGRDPSLLCVDRPRFRGIICTSSLMGTAPAGRDTSEGEERERPPGRKEMCRPRRRLYRCAHGSALPTKSSASRAPVDPPRDSGRDPRSRKVVPGRSPGRGVPATDGMSRADCGEGDSRGGSGSWSEGGPRA